MPEIKQEIVNVATALIYTRWGQADDNLKAVKRETDDGSPDWKAFHTIRLKNAQEDFNKWRGYLDYITPFHTIGKGG